jgi:hypothetical protein
MTISLISASFWHSVVAFLRDLHRLSDNARFGKARYDPRFETAEEHSSG